MNDPDPLTPLFQTDGTHNPEPTVFPHAPPPPDLNPFHNPHAEEVTTR